MSDFTHVTSWGEARAGELTTAHGVIKTPIFMPVGTQASVKALDSADVAATEAEILLGNTYHLYLRPGTEVIKVHGGLHQFMKWPGPILTDSGGFQVSSLGHFRTTHTGLAKPTKIDDEGVTFFSHLDGSRHRFTPELSIGVQLDLAADIIMAFDEATPNKGREYAIAAMNRTHAWLDRSIAHWKSRPGWSQLFGIVQGGSYQDLRQQSAQYVLEAGLPGIAIGGGNIGASLESTKAEFEMVKPLLPVRLPRYLMGVGVDPVDIISAALYGADMFDCVAPTRLARSGIVYAVELSDNSNEIPKDATYVVEFDTKPKLFLYSPYRRGRIVLTNAIYREDAEVIWPGCDCLTCKTGYSRSYLRHLKIADELTLYRLASIHNTRVMIRLIKKLRSYILAFA